MVFEGGKFYAGVTSPFQIDTLDTSTGVETFVSNPTGNPPPGNFWGLAPSILLNVAPATLRFPRQTVGTTSAPQTVTLANSGFVALRIKSIETSGDFRKSSTTCRLTLPAGESWMIDITFTPTDPGRLTGTLEVLDNAGASPQRVLLAGSGK